MPQSTRTVSQTGATSEHAEQHRPLGVRPAQDRRPDRASSENGMPTSAAAGADEAGPRATSGERPEDPLHEVDGDDVADTEPDQRAQLMHRPRPGGELPEVERPRAVGHRDAGPEDQPQQQAERPTTVMTIWTRRCRRPNMPPAAVYGSTTRR